jgi:hypothetical protein
MVKYMENMAVMALADYAVAGTPLNWTLIREHDIESIELIWCNGAVTKGAADSTGDPFWGLTWFQASYDDKIIRLPGQHLAAYNYFFFPDDPARVGSLAWSDATAAAQAAAEWYARARLAVHAPAKAGAYVSCSAVQRGEAGWTQAAANNAIAAGNLYIVPRYGSFDYQVSANYMETAAVAADTTFLPGVTGPLYVGSLIGAYTDPAAFVDGVALSSSTIYGVNTYATDNITSLMIDVAGDTIVQLPNACQAEWPFQKAHIDRIQNHAAAVATPVESVGHLQMCELLIDFGILMPAGSTVRYVINANTATVQVTTIFGTPVVEEKTGGVPVGNVKPGPGGTAEGPPVMRASIPQKPQRSLSRANKTVMVKR